MKVSDYHTFFRLQHEISEIKRRKDDFNLMKSKIFEKKDPKTLLKYDSQLKFNENNNFNDLNEQKLQESEGYLKGLKMGMKLKSSRPARNSTYMQTKTLENILHMKDGCRPTFLRMHFPHNYNGSEREMELNNDKENIDENYGSDSVIPTLRHLR